MDAKTTRLVAIGMEVYGRVAWEYSEAARCVACGHYLGYHAAGTSCRGVFDTPSLTMGTRCWCMDYEPPPTRGPAAE